MTEQNSTGMRSHKVRGAQFPQEYQMVQFLKNVQGTPSSWNTHTPVCEWDRVTCDDQDKVEKIYWDEASLSGPLEWAFLLESIKSINFHLNELCGETDFSLLPPRLTYLSIWTNKFIGTPDLTNLPDTIDLLNLSYNCFLGSVAFHSLPAALVYLYISDNQLSGTPCFINIPAKLRTIALQNNCFNGIFVFEPLFRSQSLFEMYLFGNKDLCGSLDDTKLPSSLGILEIHGTGIKRISASLS